MTDHSVTKVCGNCKHWKRRIASWGKCEEIKEFVSTEGEICVPAVGFYCSSFKQYEPDYELKS